MATAVSGPQDRPADGRARSPVSAQVSVGTPLNLIVCEPAAISLGGGKPPYTLEVLNSTDLNGTPILSFPSVSQGTFTWNVNVTAGTTVTFEAIDSGGTEGFGGQIKVLVSARRAWR